MTSPESDPGPEFDPEPAPPPPSRARRLAKCLPLVVVALVLVLFVALGGARYISMQALQEKSGELTAFTGRHHFAALSLYILAYVAVVAFSLPGALIMTLTGGFLFGAWEGSAAAVAGVTGGSAVMFLIARSALGGVLRSKIREGGRIQRIEAGIRRNAFLCILTLRLIPAMPIWLVNIAAGFVHMPFSTYVVATLVGITPSTVIYASIGSTFGRVFEQGRSPSLEMLIEPQVIGPLCGLMLLSLLPLAVQALRARRARPKLGAV
jgi:uncharacterized membrane protein YdjX (TVP38/TMEM64 family)